MNFDYAISEAALFYSCGMDWTTESIFETKYLKKGKFVLAGSIIMERLCMPRGKQNAKSSARTNTNVEWVNIPISEADEAEILKWGPDDAILFAGLADLVTSGHTVGWKIANDGDGFMAYATGTGDDCPNTGLGLSAFASDVRDAVACLLYKHLAVANSEWPRSGSGNGRKFR